MGSQQDLAPRSLPAQPKIGYSGPRHRSIPMIETSPISHPETLPCRGCQPDCVNRDRCHGQPWRIARDEADGAPVKRSVVQTEGK